MARGMLIPTILSPAEAEERLALPCLMILAGVAQPVFPTRDRGTPSPSVVIIKVRKGPDSFPMCLPVSVDWRQWRTAVVPVLEDETWRVTNLVTVGTVGTLGSGVGRARLIALLGRALRISFVGAGWGP